MGTPSQTRSTQSPPVSPQRCLPRRHLAQQGGATDLLDEIVDFAALIGYGVGEWQKTPLRDWSRLDECGKFVHRRCGLSVPRQAGKSHDAIIWVAFLVMVLGYCVLWTDHNYSTTCEMLKRFQKILGKRRGDKDAIPAFNRRISDSKAKTAQESYEFVNGGVLCFSTRTESASLGYSFDVLVYDEAQLLTQAHTQTLNPTVSHSPHKNSQIIYTGTPTRAGCPADRFKEMREEAWSDSPDDDLCWLEYGADEVGDPFDEARWPLVNPSLAEGLVSAEDIRTGVRGMKGDDLGVAQEYLGYWLPPLEQSDPPVIGASLWAESRVAERPDPGPDAKVAYGVKFSPDGACVALAVAERSQAGRVHLSLPFCEAMDGGTAWLVSWLAARANRACCACVDGKSAAGTVCDSLAALGMPRGYVLRPTADEATTAANLALQAAQSREVTHIANEALDLSAATSTRRAIGKAGGWGFGGENATPIEACGLALLALQNSKRNPTRKARVY